MTGPMLDFPDFASVAARLANNGYRPLPILRGQKKPTLADWPAYEFKAGDEARFRGWGVGLLTGTGYVALDIDVRDADAAAKVEALAASALGKAPRRIGQAPKSAMLYRVAGTVGYMATKRYRMPADAPGDKAHRVEIIGDGKQLVAYNLHPDTRQPYAWNGAGEPTCISVAELPLVSEAALREFLADADAILAEFGDALVGRSLDDDEPAAGDESHRTSDLGQRARNLDEVRAAIAFLPNDYDRDGWARIGMAIKGALGDDGWPEFERWSQKSAHYTGRDTRRVWDSFKPAKAGAGRLLYIARKRGFEWRGDGYFTFGSGRGSTSDDATTEWESPLNLLGELTAPAFTAQDVPPSLGTYPAAYARQTGIDFGIALSAALTAAAAALNDEFEIVADEATRYQQPARLWMATIAPSGSGKSPAQKHMLAPLHRIQRKEMDSYRLRVEAAKAAAEAEGTKPEHVPCPRVIVQDATIEALSEVLRDNPRGVLIANDEFESWLGSMDAYRGKGGSRDRGEWLRLFDGGPHTVERVQRGSIYVPNWGVSLLTATTPTALRKLATKLPEDGLLQRFLLIVAGRQGDGVPETHVEVARDEFEALLERLYQLVPRRAGRVRMQSEAKEAFRVWRAENRLLQEGFETVDAGLAAHVAKYPTFALRLALVFHAAEIVANKPDLQHAIEEWPIPAATMQLAFRFLKRAQQHAVAVYLSMRGESEVMELSRDVARALLAKPCSAIARRDLIQRVHAFRRADPRVQDAALTVLVDCGWLRTDPGGYVKDVPARYAVNPMLAERFAALAERERARREVVRSAIAAAAQDRREENAKC